jgi:hypothetical protein
VSILDVGEVEVFFPVGALFLKWRRAIADFDPACGVIIAEARVVHITEVFSLGDGALTKGFIFDGAKQFRFATRFNPRSD